MQLKSIILTCLCQFPCFHKCFDLNPCVPIVLFLYPPKTSENRKVFWCFQGVEKGCIANEWVKVMKLLERHLQLFTKTLQNLKKKSIYPAANYMFTMARRITTGKIRINKNKMTLKNWQLHHICYLSCNWIVFQIFKIFTSLGAFQ